MADGLVFDIKAENDATEEIEALRAELDELRDDVDDLSDSTKDAEESGDKWSKQMAAAAVVLATVKVAVVDAVKVHAELDAGIGRLDTRYKKAGASAHEFREAQRTFVENERFGITVQEQTDLLGNLITVTGDHTKAMEALNLARDISAAKGIELAEASEMVRKGMLADTGVLRDLGLMTKDQEAALAGLRDEEERIAVIQRMLNAEFAGAAEANRGLSDDIGQTRAEMLRLQAAMGKVSVELGRGTVGLVGRMAAATGVFKEGELTLGNFATGMENFASAIGETIDEIELIVEGFGKWEAAALAVGVAMTPFTGGASMVAAGAFISGAGDAAQDARARAAAEGRPDSRNQTGRGRGYANDPRGRKTPEQLLEDQLKADRASAKAERDKAAAQAAAAKRRAEAEREFQKEQREHEKAMDEIYKDRIAIQAGHIQRRTDAMIAENDFKVAQAEQWLADFEKRQALEVGHQEDLNEMYAEEAEIRAAGQDARVDAATGIGAAAGDGFSEALQIAATNEQLSAQVDLWGSLGSAVGGYGEIVGELVKQQWDFSAASDATISGLSMFAEVGGKAASAFAENTKQEASIRAIFESAAAAGATALGLVTFNPAYFAAAAQHAVAATTYSLVAGGVISSGGGASSGAASSGGGGSQARNAPTIDADAERQKTAQAFADKLAEESANRGYTVNIDLSQSTVLEETPQLGERLTRLVGSSLANTTGNINFGSL